MASIEPAADEAAMLAAGLGLGDYAFRADLKKFMRCVALPSNTIGNFALAGTPAGCSIYQDSITSEWMVSRQGESNTPLAMSTEPPPTTCVKFVKDVTCNSSGNLEITYGWLIAPTGWLFTSSQPGCPA
jgi:hypothetical protein